MTLPENFNVISVDLSSQSIPLICLGYLFTKHFIGDFVLQNAYQLSNKKHYGHPGGLLHAMIHGVLSTPLLFLVPGIEIIWFAWIIMGEIIAHYHIDWGKEQLLNKTNWSPRDKQFWRLLGFDQFLHLACYLAMTALIII